MALLRGAREGSSQRGHLRSSPTMLLWLGLGLLCLVLAGAGSVVAYALSSSRPAVYEATAEAYLSPEAYLIPSVGNHPNQRVATVAELASSPLVLAEVASVAGRDTAELGRLLDAQPVAGSDLILLTAQARSGAEATDLVRAMAAAAAEVIAVPSPEGANPQVAFSHVAIAPTAALVSPRPLIDGLVGGALGAVVGVGAGLVIWVRRGQSRASGPERAVDD